MSFYKEQMIVNKAIEDRIKQTVLAEGSTLDINSLVLDLTNVHPVSVKSIQKRVELIVKVNKDKLQILGDEVILR